MDELREEVAKYRVSWAFLHRNSSKNYMRGDYKMLLLEKMMVMILIKTLKVLNLVILNPNTHSQVSDDDNPNDDECNEEVFDFVRGLLNAWRQLPCQTI